MDGKMRSKIVQVGHRHSVNSPLALVLQTYLGTVNNPNSKRRTTLLNTTLQMLLWSISRNNEVYHSCKMQCLQLQPVMQADQLQ